MMDAWLSPQLNFHRYTVNTAIMPLPLPDGPGPSSSGQPASPTTRLPWSLDMPTWHCLPRRLGGPESPDP